MVDIEGIFSQLAGVDLTPMAVALACSAAIGLEREFHGRPAGLRTHMLVCLCATVLIDVSAQVPAIPGAEGARIVMDPQRLAAGIVTGIGFLGAAAVVRSGDMVRGLTTGASIWSVAGLGVIVGQHAYGYAVLMTAAALFVLIVLDFLPRSIGTVVYRRLRVRGQGAEMQPVADEIRGVLRNSRVRIQEVSGDVDADGSGFQLTFHIRCRSTMNAPMILDRVAAIVRVTGADWTAPRR